MTGDIFYFTATGGFVGFDPNVSDDYARTATSPGENIYSVWNCLGEGGSRHTIVTHQGRLIHDAPSEWAARVVKIEVSKETGKPSIQVTATFSAEIHVSAGCK